MRLSRRAILFLVFGAVFACAPGSDATAQYVKVTSSSPPEAQLAAIDQGFTRVRTSTVRLYAQLLDRLEQKCPEDRRRIGDMAVKGTDMLEEEGVTMTIKKFLEALDGAIPPEAAGVLKCAEAGGVLVTLLTRG